MRKSVDQKGDTIIEVLLAMVVVGLTLGIGFNLARNAQQTGQVARERSEALSLAESQLELLKSNLNGQPTAIATLGYDDSTPYCILSGDQKIADAADTASKCYEIDTIAGGNGTGFYRLQMDYDATDQSFRSSVSWDVPNSREPAVVELRYRTYE